MDEIKLKKALGVLRAITHPFRLSILSFIDKEKSVSVNNMQQGLKTDLSLLSQNLKILKSAGLVTTQRDGKFIYYSLNHQKIRELNNSVISFFEKN